MYSNNYIGDEVFLLKSATGFLQQGNFEKAIASLNQILCIAPNHAEANHLLGIVYLQQQSYQAAEACFRKSIKKNPNCAVYYLNLGIALHAVGQLNDALKIFKTAISLDKKLFKAHFNRGVIFAAQEKYKEALAAYDKALKIEPGFVAAYNNRGVVFQMQRRFKKALNDFDQAIQLEPRYAEAYNNRGNVFKLQKKYQEALVEYEKAVALYPGYVQALANIGFVLVELKKEDEALSFFDRALRLNPNIKEVLNSKGDILQRRGEFAEAFSLFEKAIALDSGYGEAYRGKALSLAGLDRYDEAVDVFRKIIERNPTDAIAYNDMGITLQQQGKLDKAKEAFKKSLEFDDAYVKAKCNLGFLNLVQGNLREGFALYESRWEDENFSFIKKHPYPEETLWKGEEIKDKTILIYTEQGAGDNIQFIRYISYVAKYCDHIVLACEKSLYPLFSSIPEVELVVCKEDKVNVRFDVHAPLLSLPYLFETTLEGIPNHVPYLFPNNKQIEIEMSKADVNVGLVWAGGAGYKNDKRRSLEVDWFSNILCFNTCKFFSLQVGKRADDIKTGNYHITDLSTLLNDYADTAAIICQLDLVISVDTSVAHLAGALGKPVWTLLSFAPDWRWMLKRQDSPWYPSMRLFRQPQVGDWKTVVKDLEMALKEFCENR